MNGVFPVETRDGAQRGKAFMVAMPSFIVVGGHPIRDSMAELDTSGIFEANLMPSDELWNRPNAFQDVVRSSQHDEDSSRIAEFQSFHDPLPTTAARVRRAAIASVVKRSKRLEVYASIPVGIWKGVIGRIDPIQRVFSAELTPLRGSDVQVSGDISFDQINEDDLPMVQLGSVFYLEQYSRTMKRQVSSDTIVRFRRGNLWTEEQLQKVAELSAALAGAMREGLARMRIAD